MSWAAHEFENYLLHKEFTRDGWTRPSFLAIVVGTFGPDLMTKAFVYGAHGDAAFLGARIEPGAAAIADLTGLSAALGTADLVVTGEGRYDAQSSIGKVAGHAIAAARAAGARVAVVAGALGSDAVLDAARGGPDELLVLADLAGGADRAIAEPARWLREAGAGLATAFSP